MIRLVEVAEFNWLKCPIDRNRELLASYFPASEFEIVALSSQRSFSGNIKVIHTGPGKINKIISYFKLAFSKGDILHTRPWPECVPIFILWKLRNPGGKHVLTVHGLPIVKSSFISAKILSKLADRVTVVSKVTRQEVMEAYGVDSVVIYNGIDTEKFSPYAHSNRRLKILYAGRLESHKNPHFVLDLSEKFPECDFYLYGEGSMKEELINRSENQDNVFIMGAVPFEKMPGIYSAADIFLFPTTNEGFANVMLEAAASGLPILCLNATSMPEFVEQDVNGYLADDFAELETYLGLMINDKEKRLLMSENSRRKALDFDWKNISRQYMDLYRKMYNE